jgi:hypothetical protein
MDLKSALGKVISRLSECENSRPQEETNIRSERDFMEDFPVVEPAPLTSDRQPMFQAGGVDRADGVGKPLGPRATERSSIEAMLQQANLRRRRFAPELRDLDLNPVRYLLRRQYHWPLERILIAEEEFLEFLAAIQRNPAQPQVPTAEADIFWHSLLLIGPLYVSVCDHVFGGKLLLHDPFHSFVRGPGGGS